MSNIEELIKQADAEVKKGFETKEEKPIQEDATTQEVEQSSLTQEVEKQEVSTSDVTAPTEVVQEQEDEHIVSLSETSKPIEIVNETKDIDENLVLTYLSEKLGKEITSVDQLTQENNRKLNPIVESMQRWMDETGYDDPMVYFKTQATDYKSLDPKTLIIEDYVLNKGMQQEQAELLYERNFETESFDEDEMTESEIFKIKKQNRYKELDRDLAQKEALTRFEQLKQKYQQPSGNAKSNGGQQAISEEAIKFWKESAQTATKALEEVVIPIGDNKGYKLSFAEYAKKNNENFNDVQKFFGNFIDKSTGTWDVQKLFKAATFADNMEVIAKSVYKQGLSDGKKDLATKGKNLNFDKAQKLSPDELRKTQLQQKIENDFKKIQERIGVQRF